MDPLSAVVGAITAAAMALAKDVASKAVSDAYEGLKNLIASRFHRKAAIDAVEETPRSPSARDGLAGALRESKASEDQEVLSLADKLATALQSLEPEKLQKANISIRDLNSYQNIFVSNLRAAGDISVVGLTARGDIVIDHANAGVAPKT